MKTIFCTAVALLLLNTSFCSAQWERMMIPESGYNLNDVAMPNSLTSIAVGEFGTILRTHDNFRTWKRCDTKSRADFFCIGAFDNRIAVTAGADGTMLRSTDGGNTWDKQNSSSADTLRRLVILSPTMAIVVGNRGVIIRTTDAGKSWSVIKSGTDLNLRGVSFNTSGVGIAVGEKGIILRSTDSGLNWQTQISPTKLDLYTVSMIDDIVCAGGDSVVIIRSIDAGIKWKLQTVLYTMLPYHRSIGLADDILDITFIDQHIGFLCGEFEIVSGVHYNRIYRTDNGGQTWQRILLPNTSENVDKFNNPAEFGVWKRLLFRDNQGIVVGHIPKETYLPATLLTNNQGIDWEFIMNKPDTVFQNLLYVNYFRSIGFIDSEILICESQNALRRSADNGLTWVKQQPVGSANNSDMNIYGDFGIIGADSGRVYISPDGGKKWNQTNPLGNSLSGDALANAYISRAVISNPTTAFCCGFTSRRHLFRTKDKGEIWEELHPNGNLADTLQWSTRYSIPSFTDPISGWILAQNLDSLGYGAGYSLYSTQNGGDNWTDKTPIQIWDKRDYVDRMQIFFLDRNHGWFTVGRLTDSGGGKKQDDISIVYTNDGGSTWTRKEFQSIPALKSYFSGNSGTSIVVDKLTFYSPKEGLIVLRDLGRGFSLILHTSDGGTTWERMTVNGSFVSEDSFLDVKYQDSSTAWIVGANRTVLRWKKESTSAVSEQPSESDGIHLFPNPTSTQFTLSGVEGVASVRVVNSLGEEVKQFAHVRSQYSIDVSDLVSGLYFVSIRTAKGAVVKPMMVSR